MSVRPNQICGRHQIVRGVRIKIAMANAIGNAVKCLVNEDVMQLILSYQNGNMYEDLVPFQRIAPLQLTSKTFPMEQFQHNNAVITPWLQLYGTSRLQKLATALPQVLPAVEQIAAYHGLHEVLLQTRQLTTTMESTYLASMAMCGNQPACSLFFREKAYSKYWTMSEFTMAWCFQLGQVDAISIYLTRNLYKCKHSDIGVAVDYGNLRVFKLAVENAEVFYPSATMTVTFQNVGFLCESLCWSPLIAAAGMGHLDIVAYLHSAGLKKHFMEALDAAILKHQFHVAKFLLANRTEGCNSTTLLKAATCGDLAVVQFLWEHYPFNWTTFVMDKAAECGHYDLVVWLHENTGNIGCTKWAMDNAASNGHLNIVEFLVKNRTEGCTELAVDGAAGNGHLNIVKYLTEIGAPCTKLAMDTAASVGRLEMVKYLHHHRSEGCSQAGFNGACKYGHLQVVEFLSEAQTDLDLISGMEAANFFRRQSVVAYLKTLTQAGQN